MKEIVNQIFDEERALYGSRGIKVVSCSFDGPADGESAFKESSDIETHSCYFNLRYPFWHCHRAIIRECEMTELCRAALWYSEDITVEGSRLHGIKALRECKNINIDGSSVDSVEFGWFCDGVSMRNTEVRGEYFMMRSSHLNFRSVELTGKYSFQYVSDSVFESCNFDTKDAFWHAKNVTVRNSVIKGEYLAWYCENVTFENCVIYGTQPLCYCKDLKLINCEMHGCDLSFEKSQVEAQLTAPIISIKNPESGYIKVPFADEIISESGNCSIIITGESPV